MAQAGYTPIALYKSTTASAAPSAGNLVDGELAINITDGKLYYKDNLGAVQLLASKAGASGDVVGPASATDNAIARFDGTTGKLIQNSAVTVADTTGDITGGAYNKVTITAPATSATLTIANGKTLTMNNSITFSGTDATTMTFPSTNTTVAGLSIAQTFTADQAITGNLTLNAQGDLRFADADSSNWVAFQSPATVASNITWTLPGTDGTNGQVLTTNGTGTLSWTTAATNITISNDTSTASNLYPVFVSATSGTASTINTSNAKLLYKPSTGEFGADVPIAQNGIFVNSNTVATSYTIAATNNGLSAGPVTVNSGVTVTVSSGSAWTVV